MNNLHSITSIAPNIKFKTERTLCLKKMFEMNFYRADSAECELLLQQTFQLYLQKMCNCVWIRLYFFTIWWKQRCDALSASVDDAKVASGKSSFYGNKHWNQILMKSQHLSITNIRILHMQNACEALLFLLYEERTICFESLRSHNYYCSYTNKRRLFRS